MSVIDSCNKLLVREDVASEVNDVAVMALSAAHSISQSSDCSSSSSSEIWSFCNITSCTSHSASSQEVSKNTEAPSTEVWGVVHPLQPEFTKLELVKDCYTFGRATENDYCFNTPCIRNYRHYKAFSKVQFALKRVFNPNDSTQTVLVEDLGATNGIYVNGKKVSSNCVKSIKHLDKIALPYCWSDIFMFTQIQANCDLPREFSTKYILHKSIGKGACGEVFETWLKEGVGQFACKVISKVRFSMDSRNTIARDAMTEAKLLLQIQHPCVIGIKDVFDSPRRLYIVLEYAAGGELFQRLARVGALPEPFAKLYFYQMLHAVAYLHKNGITHRDLKPENILLMTSCEPTLIKITDFGMSRLVGEQSLMNTLAGTPSYLAPEILQGFDTPSCPGYTKLVDMWSLGVILFVCLVAYLPFSRVRKDTQQSLKQQILSANFNFNHTRWQQVSPTAKILVTRLLKLEASERLNTAEALEHEWLNDTEMRQKAAQIMMMPDIAKPFHHTEAHANLMEEKPFSSESTSITKVRNNADDVEMS